MASDAVQRLAAAALPLLHDELETEPCPVCDTRISPRKVSAELRAKAAGASALAELDAVLRSAESARAAAQAIVSESRAQRDEMQSQWDLRVRVLKATSDLRHHLQAIEQRPTLRPARNLAIPTLNEPVGPAEYELLIQWRPRGIELLREVVAGCRALKASLADVAEQEAASRVAAERAASIPRLRERVAQATSLAVAARAAHEEARRASANAASMAEATTAASGEIFRERFALLEPLMNDVYSRLDPHPAFTRLTFVVESYRSRGTATATVVDSERDISVNPMLIFSSAQANIVVLSAFLALGWAAGGSSMPFLMLDDPLQALDDVNVLGFADLARHVRRQRQLVLATHEARFASLLERKLSGRGAGEDLLVHRFVGWSRRGPEIETRRILAGSEERRLLVAG